MNDKIFPYVIPNLFTEKLCLFRDLSNKILKQVQNDKWIKFMPLLLIILVGAFLRLYKISDYMTFLGDQGRDVLIVKQMIVDHRFTLLGPTASVGGFFLGPIYYYFMLPFLWLWRMDPVGPAVMVALFGTATIYLVYLAGKTFFNEKTGLIAAGLYAVSPLVIAYSRSSWNPNLMPFFSTMTLFCLYKGITKTSKNLLFLSGVFLGISLQLHYLSLFLAVIVGVYLFILERKHFLTLIKDYFSLFLGFFLGLSPFLAFEIRHGFPNTQTIIKFVFNGGKDTGFVGEKVFNLLRDLVFRLFWRLLTRFPSSSEMDLLKNSEIRIWVYGIAILAIITLGLFFFGVYKSFRIKSPDYPKFLLLFLWLTLGVGLFIFYKKPIYDYYLSFMFPLPFLLVANLINKTKIAGLVIFVLLLTNALSGVYFRYPPNRQLEQTKTIARFVLDKTGGKPFNFALITPANSDHAYRYFLEIWGNRPITIENQQVDPKRKTVTNQLLVVCEDPLCKPLGHSLWEIAGFGRGEIEGEWQVSVVKVFKLAPFRGI